jgi:hypothetical protein
MTDNDNNELTLGEMLAEAQRNIARNKVVFNPSINTTIPGVDATSAEQNFQMKMISPTLPGELAKVNDMANVPEPYLNLMNMVTQMLAAPERLLSNFRNDGDFPTHIQAKAHFEDILFTTDVLTPYIYRCDPQYIMLKKILMDEFSNYLSPRNVGPDNERSKHEKRTINEQKITSTFQENKAMQTQRGGIRLPFTRRQ